MTYRRSRMRGAASWNGLIDAFLHPFILSPYRCSPLSMRQVDWVPFVTRHVADDFASHLRLYRMASEKFKYLGKKGGWCVLKLFLNTFCDYDSWYQWISSISIHLDGITPSENDLLSHFFDFELEMEKTLCRDLLCTTPHYENGNG